MECMPEYAPGLTTSLTAEAGFGIPDAIAGYPETGLLPVVSERGISHMKATRVLTLSFDGRVVAIRVRGSCWPLVSHFLLAAPFRAAVREPDLNGKR
jgi:hypothetical protein